MQKLIRIHSVFYTLSVEPHFYPANTPFDNRWSKGICFWTKYFYFFLKLTTRCTEARHVSRRSTGPGWFLCKWMHRWFGLYLRQSEVLLQRMRSFLRVRYGYRYRLALILHQNVDFPGGIWWYIISFFFIKDIYIWLNEMNNELHFKTKQEWNQEFVLLCRPIKLVLVWIYATTTWTVRALKNAVLMDAEEFVLISPQQVNWWLVRSPDWLDPGYFILSWRHNFLGPVAVLKGRESSLE